MCFPCACLSLTRARGVARTFTFLFGLVLSDTAVAIPASNIPSPMPHGRGVGVLTMVMPTMYTRLSVLTCLLHRTVLQVTFEWAGANRSLSTCGLTWDPWRMEEALARCVSRQYLGSALVAGSKV